MKIFNFTKIYKIFLILPIVSGFNHFTSNNNLLGSWIIKKCSNNDDNNLLKNNCCINFDFDYRFTIKQPIIFGLNKIYSGSYQKNPNINNFCIKVNKLNYTFNDLNLLETYYNEPKIEYKYYTDASNSPYIIFQSNKINSTILYLEKLNIQKPNTELIICQIMIVSNIILTSYLIYLYFNLLSLIYRNIMHN